jgi:hypothetical protein
MLHASKCDQMNLIGAIERFMSSFKWNDLYSWDFFCDKRVLSQNPGILTGQ